MKYENGLLISEEAMYSKDFKNPIYIVLMHTGTPMANAIKTVTGDMFSHACIAFNSSLDPMYSFGASDNGMGLVINRPKDKFFTKFQAKYNVYCMFVSAKAYAAIENRLKWFVDHKSILKYDFVGLIDIWMGKESEDHEKFFCSRFVMDLVSKAQALSKVPSLWKPSDISDLSNISLVNRGYDFYNYDKKITDKHVRAIKTKTYNADKVVISENISNGAIKDFESPEDMNLGRFTKMGLNDSFVQIYKKTYPRLSHLRINNKTKGFVWLDGQELVAVVNTEEKKNDEIWIQGMEVFGRYKGHGLAKQVLNVACSSLHATNLSVAKNNEIAIKVYKKYGFKTYGETDTMYFMSKKELLDESFAGMTDEELHQHALNIKTPFIDEDYERSASYARSVILSLHQNHKLQCCTAVDNIYKDGDRWIFSKFYIENESDIKQIGMFIITINERLEATTYPGYIPFPENMAVSESGTLCIHKGLVAPTVSVTEASIKHYKNPTLALKQKLGKKRNDRIKLGNYSDAGKYDVSSAPPTPSTPSSFSPSKPSSPTPVSAEEEVKNLEEAAYKANDLIHRKLKSLSLCAYVYEDAINPYDDGSKFSVIKWDLNKLKNQHESQWEKYKNMVYEFTKNSFANIRKGYIMEMDDECIYVKRNK